MVRVVDRDKTFTSSLLSQNWANTPEQRALMLEYPMSSLVIESEDSGHSR
jgi:ABC-type hemin transport system ATPase subunit